MGPGGEGPAEPLKAFPPRDSSDSAVVLSLWPRGRCLDSRLCSYGSELPRGEQVTLLATGLTLPLAHESMTSDQDLPELRIGQKVVSPTSLRCRARKLKKDSEECVWCECGKVYFGGLRHENETGRTLGSQFWHHSQWFVWCTNAIAPLDKQCFRSPRTTFYPKIGTIP